MRASLQEMQPVGVTLDAVPQRLRSGGAPRTSLPDPATDATFEQALTREIIRSERLRLGIVAGFLGVGFAGWIAAWIAPMLGGSDLVPSRSGTWVLTVVGSLAIAYELYAVSVAIRALQRGRLPSKVTRYRNAFIEISVPTLFLLLSVETRLPM